MKTSNRVMALVICLQALGPYVMAKIHPPSKPAIPPLIADRYPNDTNGDRIDDRLTEKAQKALAEAKATASPEQHSTAEASLREVVDVEVIFKEPVTQQQIDAFIALGGEITYLYKAV